MVCLIASFRFYERVCVCPILFFLPGMCFIYPISGFPLGTPNGDPPVKRAREDSQASTPVLTKAVRLEATAAMPEGGCPVIHRVSSTVDSTAMPRGGCPVIHRVTAVASTAVPSGGCPVIHRVSLEASEPQPRTPTPGARDAQATQATAGTVSLQEVPATGADLAPRGMQITDLPDDVLARIAVNLPQWSLLQFTAVCQRFANVVVCDTAAAVYRCAKKKNAFKLWPGWFWSGIL